MIVLDINVFKCCTIIAVLCPTIIFPSSLMMEIYLIATPCLFLQVGPSCSGKSSILHCLASLAGQKLLEFPMNSDTDTIDLLGGFEQVSGVGGYNQH